jgi:hypothetical protein
VQDTDGAFESGFWGALLPRAAQVPFAVAEGTAHELLVYSFILTWAIVHLIVKARRSVYLNKILVRIIFRKVVFLATGNF